MKTALKPNLKSKTFIYSKRYIRLEEKETSLFDFRFYQKIFVLFISLSTFLIFPETPKELQNICESNNPKQLCNVW